MYYLYIKQPPDGYTATLNGMQRKQRIFVQLSNEELQVSSET